MKPEFRFRLNGEIVPEIFIQRAMVDGEPVVSGRSPSILIISVVVSPLTTTQTSGTMPYRNLSWGQ
jgi:hypothetical protein